jgi:hypothetical protein
MAGWVGSGDWQASQTGLTFADARQARGESGAMGTVYRCDWGLVVLAGALALGACGKSQTEPDKVADAGDMASKVGQGVAAPLPQPGRWETVMKLESLDMPNMPPQAKAMMEKSMADGRTFATCLTADQANRPPADFFGYGQAGCEYDSFQMAEGRMEGTLSCRSPHGRLRIAMSGQYAADSYEVHTDSRMSGPGGQEMAQKMTLKARRVGDCRGNELNAGKAG